MRNAVIGAGYLSSSKTCHFIFSVQILLFTCTCLSGNAKKKGFCLPLISCTGALLPLLDDSKFQKPREFWFLGYLISKETMIALITIGNVLYYSLFMCIYALEYTAYRYKNELTKVDKDNLHRLIQYQKHHLVSTQTSIRCEHTSRLQVINVLICYLFLWCRLHLKFEGSSVIAVTVVKRRMT